MMARCLRRASSFLLLVACAALTHCPYACHGVPNCCTSADQCEHGPSPGWFKPCCQATKPTKAGGSAHDCDAMQQCFPGAGKCRDPFPCPMF